MAGAILSRPQRARQVRDLPPVTDWRRAVHCGLLILEYRHEGRIHTSVDKQQLAEKAGLSKPYLSQLESGKRNGTTDILKKLAQALSVGLDELVDANREPT